MSQGTDLDLALHRLGRAVFGRRLPETLSSALRRLPLELGPDDVEVLSPTSDSRVGAERRRTRGPTLTSSYLLTFCSATLDVAVDVFPDDGSRTATLCGVVLTLDQLGQLDVHLADRSVTCDQRTGFTFAAVPFGEHEAKVVRDGTVIARFIVDVT